jgi:molybdate transport system substrate-binding protein
MADSKAMYATGHLVLYSTREASFHPNAMADLTDARVVKIAIANPDHAPYGKAARQAMGRQGSDATGSSSRSPRRRPRPGPDRG